MSAITLSSVVLASAVVTNEPDALARVDAKRNRLQRPDRARRATAQEAYEGRLERVVLHRVDAEFEVDVLEEDAGQFGLRVTGCGNLQHERGETSAWLRASFRWLGRGRRSS